MKLQLVILVLIIIAFGIIFTYTQKDSISNLADQATQPTISLPPGEFNAIPSPTPLSPEQQAILELQQQAQETANLESVSAIIQTSKGDIQMELYNKETPFAVANFTKKAKAGFYNGLTFHRVEDWVIQGGDPLGDGTGGGMTPTELTQKPFTIGSVGYAASGSMQVGQGERVSSGSQFFIVKQDAEHLNGQYTNFGQVTSGMEIVEEIEIGDKIQSITFQ